jgi:hypothetical protein
MVKEKKNNYTNLKKALKNIGGKQSMKNKLITFFGGSLSNYLLNFCCIYNGVKNAFGDKVVITGSAAILLHAINILGLEELNKLEVLQELVSIVKLEDSGKFRIKSDFDFLIVQKEPNINLQKITINEFEYNRVQDEPGRSLTFKSDNETCPDIDISVKLQINYNEINYNGKIYNVHNLHSLLEIYNEYSSAYNNINKIDRNGNKIKLLEELIENKKSNTLINKIHKIEREIARPRFNRSPSTRRGLSFGNNTAPRRGLSFDNNSNNSNNSNNNNNLTPSKRRKNNTNNNKGTRKLLNL